MGMKPRPGRHVALMRGINVGGKNKLPMVELRALFEAAGCTDVATYIQSGNVVFSATPTVAAGLAATVAAAIEARFDMRVPVVLRTAAELRAAIAANPFLADGVDPGICHLMFLRDRPEGALDPDRSPGDQFALIGRDLYLALPNGAARTRLTNDYVDRALATLGTMRNWRTVERLAEML